MGLSSVNYMAIWHFYSHTTSGWYDPQIEGGWFILQLNCGRNFTLQYGMVHFFAIIFD